MNIEQETNDIQQHLDKGNYHAAMNIAISAVNAGRKENDQHAIDHFLDLISVIAETMMQEFGS